MPYQLQDRDVWVNQSSIGSRPVVTDESGKVFCSVDLLKELGLDVRPLEKSIRIDALPRLSVLTEGGKLKLIRTPGSPRFDKTTRTTPITKAAADGKSGTLNLDVTVSGGAITGLTGTLDYAKEGVTANVTFDLVSGKIVPSGEVTVSLGKLQIDITGNPQHYTGAVSFESGDCKLSFKMTSATGKPTSCALSLSIAF